MNTPTLLSLISFAIILVPIIIYFSTIPRGKVPVKVGGFVAILVFGVVPCLVVIIMGITSIGKSGLLTYVPAVLGILFAAPVLFLFIQPKAPLGDIQVKVGDKILPFKAKTPEGTAFDSAVFSRNRILLKFYRGGWCPYCSAELVAFDETTAELNKFGVYLRLE